jgi:transposase-like protein
VLKNKRSRKETRETIRRLYLNYLGAHSIAKELDLDVGIVMDILRGYGIQGREF